MTETGFVELRGKTTIDKDANAILDYSFDWSSWLNVRGVLDTIDSYNLDLSGSTTAQIITHAAQAGVVTAYVSGGAVGETLKLRCRIVTNQGRTDDRTVYLQVGER
jgi:hypothetical protein